jgi:hypothetical protein
MRGLLQFTMDLFEGLGNEFAPAKPPERKPGKVKKKAPPVVAPAAAPPVADAPQQPIHAGPALPAVPLRDTLALASFVHPQATREAVLGSARVAYEFKRGKRKTIGFLVGAEGLSVRAPRWVTLRDVDAAIQEKADWIIRKLLETRQRHARVEATRIEWKDGAEFPFMRRTPGRRSAILDRKPERLIARHVVLDEERVDYEAATGSEPSRARPPSAAVPQW